MVARIDPTKCRLYPETIPEALAITSSASGANIASYAAFKPFVMILKDLITNQVATETVRIDTDAGHGVIESPLAARPLLEPSKLDILVEDSMDLWAVGAVAEARYAYTLRVTQLTVFEKIKYGVALTVEESALAKEYDIVRKYLAGIMKPSESPQFKRIIEVAKKVTVAAGSKTRVGRIVNVRSGEKAVLLGMAADSATVAGGVGSNDTYLAVNRDVRDLNYVKLDTIAMPVLTHEIECHIPAIDRLEVELQSVTGIAALPVRYRYGIADLTVLEKIRWGLPLTSIEAQDAESFNLFDAVAAGVL